MGGEAIFDINEKGDENCLYMCNGRHDLISETAMIQDGYNEREIPFYDVFYRINEIKSGSHHPDGILWFKTGNHKQHTDKASILDVFPTVADMMNVRIPEEAYLSGRSLTSDF